MKKSTFVLSAILCAGLVKFSYAQPEQPTFAAVLVEGKKDFKAANYEAAAKDTDTLLNLAASPEETGEALTLSGETFYRRKMYDEANAQWAKMLELHDTDDDDEVHAAAHFGYARTYAAQGDFAKAIPEYKTVINQIKADQADTDDDETVDINQVLAPFAFALADAYYYTKQYDLAQEQLTQIIQQNEGDYAYRLLALAKTGEIDVIQRKFKQALDAFNQLLALRAVAQETAKKETPGKIREMIPVLESLAKAEQEAGQTNDGKPEVNVVPPKEIAEALSSASATVMDEVFNQIFIESLGE